MVELFTYVTVFKAANLFWPNVRYVLSKPPPPPRCFDTVAIPIANSIINTSRAGESTYLLNSSIGHHVIDLDKILRLNKPHKDLTPG